jgi:adenosylcobyric acid synthase
MLGDYISDTIGAEEGGTIKGMGLLSMDTVFQEEKIRTRVVGSFGQIDGILKSLSYEEIEGYEIHMGISSIHKELASMAVLTNQIDGKVKLDGAYCNNIYGTYIHGIFDKIRTVERLVLCLAKEKNIDMENVTLMDHSKYKEAQYDYLADTLREHLDMSKIYEILNS